MARILFLAHRIPYPPNKGDKIRSWNFLSRMMADVNNRVHLGFFVDDAEDHDYLPMLEEQAASICYSYMSPLEQKIWSLAGLISGRSLTECAYPSSKIKHYVSDLLNSDEIDLIFLFSAATYTWLPTTIGNIPIISDLVDVDSEKWRAYSETASWPMSLIYRREANKLFEFESHVAATSEHTFFVSHDESNLFKRLNEGLFDGTSKVSGLVNGVDIDAFDPARYPSDTRSDSTKIRLIFTGAMDYQPNIEAVCWFVDKVLPKLSEKRLPVEFFIAGRPVAPEVQKLSAISNVIVRGGVPDMAEEIASADIVVAPLLTARGIQNKVLEGLAMAKPVVATSMANEGINAVSGHSILIADTVDDFVSEITGITTDQTRSKLIGKNARKFVRENFSWDKSYEVLCDTIDRSLSLQKTGDAP